MKLIQTYYFFFLFLISIRLFGQTSPEENLPPIDFKNDSILLKNDSDSIIYPKIYWNVNDKKRYKVTNKEIRLDGDVVINDDEYNYDVFVEVEKVYQNETTMKWSIRDFSINSKKTPNNPLILVNNVSISYKIDQDGRFLNYVELDKTIRELILSSENLENKYLDNPEVIAFIKKNIQKYSNEEDIIKLFEKDIRQFHHFYGKSHFSLEKGPFIYESYLDNLFSPSPTPAITTMKLNEISSSHTSYIMSSLQEANKEWLANSWYSYLKELAKNLGTEEPSEKRLKDDISYSIKTTSRIKDNGWISYSIETKKVKFQDTDYTLERRFELID